jgi:hypothetical protein
MNQNTIAGWDQWKVTTYTGKRRDIILGSTFVRARSEQHARELGKSALKLIGIRGKFNVSAAQYFPWRDIAFLNYIARSCDEPANI